jgi:hypothetical protein
VGVMWKLLNSEVPIRAIECRSLRLSAHALDPKIATIEHRGVKA